MDATDIRPRMKFRWDEAGHEAEVESVRGDSVRIKVRLAPRHIVRHLMRVDLLAWCLTARERWAAKHFQRATIPDG